MITYPKTVKLILYKGVNLAIIKSRVTETKETKIWRAIFYGGTKLFQTDEVPDKEGEVEWNTEVDIEIKNPKNPIVIIVRDAKKREAGQLIINLESITSFHNPDEKVDINREILRIEPLEKTKNTDIASGILHFRIYATETAQAEVNRSKSIKSSISQLSQLFKPTKRYKSNRDDVSQMSFTSRLRKFKKKSGAEPSIYSGSMISGNSGNGTEFSRNSSFSHAGWNGNPMVFNGQSYNPEDGESTTANHYTKSKHKSNLSKAFSKSTTSLFESTIKSLSRKNSEVDSDKKSHQLPLNSVNAYEIRATTPASNRGDVPITNGYQKSPVLSPQMSPKWIHPDDNRLPSNGGSADKPPKHDAEFINPRQEIAQYIKELENKNKSLTNEISQLTRVNEELRRELAQTNKSLNETRIDLSNLKNSLLADNLEKYLEVKSSKSDLDNQSTMSPFDSKSTGYHSAAKFESANQSPMRFQQNDTNTNSILRPNANSITDIHNTYW